MPRPLLLLLLVCCGGGGDPPAAQDMQALALHIDWKRLPDRPVGTQDSAAGILDGDFVIVGGNRGRQGTPAHAGQAGMYTGGQAISVSKPQQGWRNVSDVPSTTPDGHTSTSLGFSTGATASMALPNSAANSALAFAGGFSHTNCSKQAFLMTKTAGIFHYERLPDLPWDIAESNLVAVGSKLYSVANCNLNASFLLNFLLKMQR